MRIPRLLLPLYLLAPVFMTGCGDGGSSGGEAATAARAGTEDTSVIGPYLLVVNKSSNTLSVVNPETGLEVKVIETGFAPHEVAVSRDGKVAYVTDYGSGQQPGNTITLVDLQALEPVGKISLGPHTRPHGVEVARDGTLWVTTEGSAHVLQVDPATGEILQAVETGQSVTHMVAVAEESGRVVTANIGSGTATIVDPSTHSVVAHLETGAGAEGLTIHPDGRKAYVTNRSAGTLVEIDLENAVVARSMEVGDFPIRVKVRPGGGELLVSNANGNEVVAVDPEAWTILRRLPVGAAPIGILITPDNRTAYVANTQDDKVTVIDLVNWAVAGEIVPGDEPDGMAWVG